MLRYITCFLLLFSIVSCKPRIYSPKPTGYFAIDTPAKHEYKLFDEPGFPYSFEYPIYSNIGKDTVFQKDSIPHPYWININFPSLNGSINLTYVAVDGKHPLFNLVRDAYGLSYFHKEKSQGIDDREFDFGNNVKGVLYEVEGNTASRYQFFATDSIHHFIRGSLYFDVTPNVDSLKPATDFLKKDIEHMLLTLRWKDKN